MELLHDKGYSVPSHSNASFGYVAATSFRGEFLKGCTAFLDQSTIEMAWRSVISPSEAVAYGWRLVARRIGRPRNRQRRGHPPSANLFDALKRAFWAAGASASSVQEQRQIIDVAGRWYVLWGGRGNPVWANF